MPTGKISGPRLQLAMERYCFPPEVNFDIVTESLQPEKRTHIYITCLKSQSITDMFFVKFLYPFRPDAQGAGKRFLRPHQFLFQKKGISDNTPKQRFVSMKNAALIIM